MQKRSEEKTLVFIPILSTMEDGTQVKLSPSESTPYENGVVTLYSHLPSTIDLRKIAAINIIGQEIIITNPFQ